ncbi:MAG TPA: hypothetical protein PLX69_22290 [Leptospiraceae bacterium]|nr:hypothetical protein [Leptospiraceae bacterium]HRG77305.1 hypothetical protein [Leptospiraceae bacterium]
MSQLQKLLNAHIEYEVSAWKGENLKKSLKFEIESLYDAIVEIEAEKFIDKKTILDYVKSYINSREIEKEAEDLVLSLAETTHTLISKNQEPLTSLFTKNIFEDSMNMGMGMKELRKDIIHTVINSPVYTKMISSVMFNAIADFVGGENSFAKNVPGAFSLFKMGQDFLGNIPGVQAGIEKNLTAFIQSNLQNSLKQSEKLLNQELDAKTSKELTDEIWNFISAKKISDLQHYADKDDIKKILAVTKAEWNHIKTSPLLLQILESHIDVILTRYKGKKINELLSLYKIQKSDITDNLGNLLGSYISLPEMQAHLQKRITLRLEGFYNSENAKTVLS